MLCIAFDVCDVCNCIYKNPVSRNIWRNAAVSLLHYISVTVYFKYTCVVVVDWICWNIFGGCNWKLSADQFDNTYDKTKAACYFYFIDNMWNCDFSCDCKDELLMIVL